MFYIILLRKILYTQFYIISTRIYPLFYCQCVDVMCSVKFMYLDLLCVLLLKISKNLSIKEGGTSQIKAATQTMIPQNE